jgi:hypothetical protein
VPLQPAPLETAADAVPGRAAEPRPARSAAGGQDGLVATDLDVLTGPGAGALLSAAVATAGGEVTTWSVRQVDHRPGRSTTVSYRASVRWPQGVRAETLGASLGRPDDAQRPGVVALADGDRTAAVWMFQDDPGLPALRPLHEPRALARLLRDLRVPDAGGPARLQVRAYRPTRRAVVEASTPRGRVFLKVVRPDRVGALHARHALLADAGLPVPRPLGWTDNGLLALAPLRGTPMRDVVRDGGRAPSPAEVLELLDRLPAGVRGLPRRRSWSEGAGHYAAVIGIALPQEAQRAARLAAAVTDAVAGDPGDEPTHGDLYEAQVLLTGGRITGLLDVDSAGPGHRADDLGCLVAHLETLSLLRGWDAPRLRGYAREHARAYADAVGADALAVRTAGVLLSLATGPHRVQEAGWREATSRRLDAVERWLDGTALR